MVNIYGSITAAHTTNLFTSLSLTWTNQWLCVFPDLGGYEEGREGLGRQDGGEGVNGCDGTPIQGVVRYEMGVYNV